MSNKHNLFNNVAIYIGVCDNRRVGYASTPPYPLFLTIIEMYTLRNTKDSNDRHSEPKQHSIRVQLARFVGGPRIALRGFLDDIAPHYPSGAVFPFFNPIFQHLQVLGHDVYVDHAHIREMDVAGKRGTINRLRESVQTVCEFTAKVGTYFKRDKATGKRYTDYRFTEVEGVITVSEEEQFAYENWCYDMGYMTPPSTHGVFQNSTTKDDDIRYDY